MNPEIKQAVAIPDEEYNKLRVCAKTNGKRGYIARDKGGKMHRFFMKGQTLYGEHKVGDKLEEYEVMAMSEALKKQQEMNADNQFKTHIMNRMKSDHPDMKDEDIEANADIVCEANDTIKRLIASGTSPDVAYKLISGVLHSDDLKEHIIRELKSKSDVENKE